MITPSRSLHHLSAPSLEQLERDILSMNLIMQQAIEVFQVEKIGKNWYAYFNVDSVKFSRFKQGLLSRKLASNDAGENL